MKLPGAVVIEDGKLCLFFTQVEVWVFHSMGKPAVFLHETNAQSSVQGPVH